MRPNRLLAPFSAVLLLAALIGCGGDGSSIVGSTDGTTNNTSGDNGGTTDLRPIAGTYNTTFSGVAGSTTVTGTGTATAASDGTLTATLPAANASDATARTLNATVTSTGAASGTLTVGANAAIVPTLTFSSNSGTYTIKATFTNASSVSETDTFTFTAQQINYAVTSVGTDNFSGRYTGSGTASVTSGNILSLSYQSSRSPGGAGSQTQKLSTTLLPNGTLSGGTLSLGTTPTTATGTWSTTATGLKVVLKYSNETVVIAPSGAHPTVTETLTLTKQ